MRASFLLTGCILLGVLTPTTSADDKNAQKVSFEKQVAPILVKNCLACHGERQPKGGYQLYTVELMLKAGDSVTDPITAGKPDDSELLRLISETDKDSWMPWEGDRLADEEIEIVRRWIAEGAKFDGDPKATLVSLAPRVYEPAPESYRVPMPVTAVAFNPAGAELAVSGYNEITIWNPADGKLLRRIKNVAQRTYSLAYSPDGKTLAAASGVPGVSGEVKLFNPANGDAIKLLGTMSDVAFCVAFSPKGDKLAAASADRSIRIYDLASGKEESLIEDHADWVMSVAWNHDGTKLASASRDKTSKVFDAKTGESETTYNGHGQPVYGVCFSPDGKQVLTSGGDKKIHVWNPADGKKVADIGGFGHEVYQVFCVGGNIYSCSADKTARQHGLAKRNQVRSFAGHADWVYTLSFSAAAKRLATGTFNGDVVVWNTEDGKQLLKFTAAPGFAQAKSPGSQ